MSKKVGFVSLGCPKNLVDSEVMLGRLSGRGFEITAEPGDADVIVVNTCSFIDKAKQESIDTILEMARYKDEGSCQKLVVSGCLAQRYASEIRSELPEVDAVIGLDQLESITDVCGADESPGALSGAAPLKADGSASYLYDHLTPRTLATPSHYAYLKISEGCDYPCTFCIIPKIRGSYRSRKPDSILAEAEALGRRGVKELLLIAQDTTRYGQELGMRNGLAELLRQLAGVDGIEWIRFLYAYPTTVDDSVLEAMAEESSLCRYVDIPLQHASDSVLKAMKRPGTGPSNLALLERMREAVPSIAVRSSFIVGFPGETEADFRRLVDFVGAAELDHVGVFTYSNEEGTEAFVPSEAVSAEQKAERRDRLMALQQGISLRRNQARVGAYVRAIVDGVSEESEHLLEARTEWQAPSIDGVVLINEGTAPQGSFADVQLTEAHEYDLVGRIVEARETAFQAG
jgi:ribosomal protein S12 methylthiotransferase